MPAPKNAPLYQQIYDEIKDAIEKGVYAPKERIPSELELAEQYEVSRITAVSYTHLTLPTTPYV